MDEHFRRGWTAQLGAFLDIARLVPYPLGSTIPSHLAEALASGTVSQVDAADAAGFDGDARALFRTLTAPQPSIPVRCLEPGIANVRRLGTVHNQRLVILQTGRAPLFESGWRPTRSLVVDLLLLQEEHALGISTPCPNCERTHIISYQDLRTFNAVITPNLPDTTTESDQYPHVEQAAFAEIWGDLDPSELARPVPDVYLVLPESRDQRYRSHFAGNPVAITGQYQLLASAKQRILGPSGDASLTPIANPADSARRIIDPPGHLPAD